ncbi:MAG: nitrate reductase molybdenum cofactor assembly chaperone [Burkholderiales bacterium]|nr:nitrate reductase molybdenum cofactor assembly chaperone [Burkholderiales bacterium]
MVGPVSQPLAITLRALAALLGYPDARLREHLPDLREAVSEQRVLTASRRGELVALIDALAAGDTLQVEAQYVELFDRGRATSLHLFEHVHGDSRDRGPAIIDLGRTYAEAGLALAEGELPDYLPVVLEFASTQPPREARAFLGEMAHILNAILAALVKRESAYASVLAALLEVAGEKVTAVTPAADDPLDQSWEEPAAFDGCSTRGQERASATQPVQIVRKHPSGALR